MEVIDPSVSVSKPKRERTPAQIEAQKKAFAALTAKREALKNLTPEPLKRGPKPKAAAAPTAPAAPVSAPAAPAAPAAPSGNTIVSPPVSNTPDMTQMMAMMMGMMTAQQAPKQRKERKKKVVEESSSDEEEVVVVKKKKEKPVKIIEAEPVIEKPRSTGSRVLDNLFFR